MITRAREATFKAKMQQYIDDTQSYVIAKQGDVDSQYGFDQDVKNYIYAGYINLNATYKERLVNTTELMRASLTEDKLISTTFDPITNMEDEFDKSHLAVEAGELVWFAENDTDEYVQWLLDLGIKIFVIGKGYITEDGSYQVGSSGSYTNTIGDTSYTTASGIYCCSPDLKNSFNTGATYYVTYGDVNNSESIDISKAIYKDAPSNWYDYGNKSWANIITISSGKIMYLTWVPRYVVKVNSEGKIVTTANGEADIKFVNEENEYWDVNGTKMSYIELQGYGYTLPDAFTFGGQDLKGIWVSKYEISDPIEPIGFMCSSLENSIEITDLTFEGGSGLTADAPISEDIKQSTMTVKVSGGDLAAPIEITGTLPIKIEALRKAQTYTVQLTLVTKYMDTLVLTQKVRTLEGDVNDVAAPDLSGFSANNTYYVLCDSDPAQLANKDGTNLIQGKISTKSDDLYTGRKIASDPPEGWYDYSDKKWANIVTMNAKGEAVFLTWVPRYAFYFDEEQSALNVVYVTANVTNKNISELGISNYQIPDCFTFEDTKGKKVELSGMWVSKYEVEDIVVPTGLNIEAISNGFKLASLSYAGGSKLSDSDMPKTGTLTIKNSSGTVISGYPKSSVNVGDTITLTTPGIYTVEFTIPLSYSASTSNTSVAAQTVTVKETINVKSNITANAPDLSGFAKSSTQNTSSYTYYLEYATTSTQQPVLGSRVYKDDGTLNTAPSGWYDYNGKKWANILVSNESLDSKIGKTITDEELSDVENVAIFVWVPRYEFKLDEKTGSLSVLYVQGTSDVTNEEKTAGYAIPDAFEFNEVPLTGFWVGKGEINSTSTGVTMNTDFDGNTIPKN